MKRQTGRHIHCESKTCAYAKLIFCRFYTDFLAASHIRSAYCYSCRTNIALFVCLSLGVLVTRMYCSKMAEPIEMPFGMLTHVGPRKHVLDGVEMPTGRGNFLGLFGSLKSIATYAAKGIIFSPQ